MKNRKRIVLIISILFSVMVLALATSYALFTINVTKNSNFKMAIGSLELSITDTNTEDKFIMENTVPTKDEVALNQDGYTFTITNTGTIDSYYTVYLDDILLNDAGDRLDNSYVKFNLLNNNTNKSITKRLTDYESSERTIISGYLEKEKSITYTLRMWVDYEAGNDAQNKYFATQIRVVGIQSNSFAYKEEILNGADPVLSDNLVPIEIADDGTVTKANLYSQWYSYENKKWANAVVLKEVKTYKNGEVIPESNIESYFVWIPKYSYQLWDLGDYSSLTTVDSTKPHAIPIKFGLTNTNDSNTGECTTPGTAGESGNCKVGDYMTHPAFLAFDSNGFWVGKFETGYDGATTKAAAQVNSSDSSKIIIKPNVYSWRSLTLGNMFKASYDYLRNDESHMMKNTEWGAVAYLSHSVYGTCIGDECTEVRRNNNSSFITGYAAISESTCGYNTGESSECNLFGTTDDVTKLYNTNIGYTASTTGNISGIYDMSGGSAEYVAAYSFNATTTGGSSGILEIYDNFFVDYGKYYDSYTSTYNTQYNNRILGDTTGEMGPFSSNLDLDDTTRYKSSWYADYARFITKALPWFYRSANYHLGSYTGIFATIAGDGSAISSTSYRIVLTPTK